MKVAFTPMSKEDFIGRSRSKVGYFLLHQAQDKAKMTEIGGKNHGRFVTSWQLRVLINKCPMYKVNMKTTTNI